MCYITMATQNTTQGLRKHKIIDKEKEQQKLEHTMIYCIVTKYKLRFEEDNFIRLNTKRRKV